MINKVIILCGSGFTFHSTSISHDCLKAGTMAHTDNLTPHASEPFRPQTSPPLFYAHGSPGGSGTSALGAGSQFGMGEIQSLRGKFPP